MNNLRAYLLKKKTTKKQTEESIKSEGEEFMEFPILSPLDTAQFIKGVILMGNSAGELVLGVGLKRVFWLR